MSGAHPCGADRGAPVADLGYTAEQRHVLTIARHYFSSFAQPDRQGWLLAISSALHLFDHDRGPDIAVATLAVVQTMRRARQSTFRFNAPDCPACAAHVTPQERAMMSALRATAQGRDDAARAHAAILCEGNDAADFLRALRCLADRARIRPIGQAPGDQTRDPALAAGSR
jgi:hypothetical protein